MFAFFVSDINSRIHSYWLYRGIFSPRRVRLPADYWKKPWQVLVNSQHFEEAVRVSIVVRKHLRLLLTPNFRYFTLVLQDDTAEVGKATIM
jgi:hypothetical protein